MANTQGLGDEAVESLLSDAYSPSSSANNANSSTAASSRRNRTTSARHQAAALEERMQLPAINDRPAAKVVNKRPKQKKGTPITSPFGAQEIPLKKKQPEQNTTHDDHNNPNKDSNTSTAPSLAVMGSIVERRVTGRRRNKKKTQTSSSNDNPQQHHHQQAAAVQQSRFVREQRQLQPPGQGAGFPSVDVPLGTFVQKTTLNSNILLAAAAAADSNHPTPPLSSNNGQTTTTTTSSSTSEDDAQAMLSRMSPEEIKMSIQELQSSLSPESIAFLKNRKKKKQQHQQKQQSVASTTTDNVIQEREGKEESKQQATQTGPLIITSDLDRAEKERLASLLSSVKTYEDLDAAYAAEMGDEAELPTGVPKRSTTTTSTRPNGQNDNNFLLACDLLRSTAPRQNLWAARVVFETLEKDWNEGRLCSLGSATNSQLDQDSTPWPYPTLLPVSLRCLLDASPLRVNGYILHTYVLQSLHLLLRLRVCVEHDVDITGMTDTAQTYFQTMFLDDAVPTPDPNICYNTASSNQNSQPNQDGVYASESSSESAQKDGHFFARDPMETLLSKMQIVPRLEQLVRDSTSLSSSPSQVLLPQEAIVAICGILAMLGQRSSAAATSIVVQHASLLTDLIDLVTVPSEGSSRCNPTVALPVVVMLSVLARQSRQAAQGLVLNEFLGSPILVQTALNDAEFRLQRQTIILWRTLLRYGLGFPHLETMLTVAAPHLAVGFRGLRSLSADYVSCFTLVAMIAAAAQKDSDDSKILLEEEQRNILAVAGVWLSSSARQALAHLASASSINEEDMASELRSYASCLGLVDAFMAMGDSAASDDTASGEFKTQEITLAEEDGCVSSLVKLIDNGVVDLANAAVISSCYDPDFDSIDPRDQDRVSTEAAASAFLESCVTFSMSLLSRSVSPDRGTASPAARLLAGKLGSSLTRALESSGHSRNQQASTRRAQPLPRARKAWLNRSHVAVLNLLQSTEFPVDPSARTALVSAIFGRLDIGEEKLAVDLLKSHGLLRADLSASTLSKMFLHQMSGTAQRQSQLDHSERIYGHRDIGLVNLFELQSLQSHVDSQGTKNDPPADQLLPVGKYWLWKLLASARDGSSDAMDDETRGVLSGALLMISELEESDDKGVCHYASRLNPGAKTYFLMNLCLQSEECLYDQSMMLAASHLLSKYSTMMDADFAIGFARACFLHSSTGSFRAAAEAEDLSSAEKKMASILDEDGPGDSLVLPARVVRCLKDFMVDLITGYIDYGAQYDFFTGCLRIFLSPAFPSKIRCEAVVRLKGLLHLFTLETENDALVASIENYLPFCSASDSTATCDAPEFVDALVGTIGDGSRPDARFIISLTVALLTLDLVQVLRLGKSDSRYAVTKQRFRSVPMPIFIQTFQASVSFLVSSKRSVHELALAAVEADNDAVPIKFNDELDEPSWNHAIDFLTKTELK